MDGFLPQSVVPEVELRKLEFLVGEAVGQELAYPGIGQTVCRGATWLGSREHCDRFLQINYICIDTSGEQQHSSAMVSYSSHYECFVMWIFSSQLELPIELHGKVSEGSLVLISNPLNIAGVLNRIRITLSRAEERLFFKSEVWTPDGYVLSREAVLVDAVACI